MVSVEDVDEDVEEDVEEVEEEAEEEGVEEVGEGSMTGEMILMKERVPGTIMNDGDGETETGGIIGDGMMSSSMVIRAEVVTTDGDGGEAIMTTADK